MQVLVVTKKLEFIRDGRLIEGLVRYLNASDIVLVVPSNSHEITTAYTVGYTWSSRLERSRGCGRSAL